MGRFFLACRAFFRILGSRELAEQVVRLLAGAPATPASPAAAAAPQPKPAPAAVRSDALSLLSALQREARFVDFIQEPIGAYSDAQIGAAVRNIHRDSAALVERVFGLEPIEKGAEGSPLEVPAGFDPSRIRLLGNVSATPPLNGRLAHHGWQARRCELPEWTGGQRGLLVIAPAEVEV